MTSNVNLGKPLETKNDAEKPATTWEDLIEWHESLGSGGWCFRGEGKADREPQTTLERDAIERWGLNRGELPQVEEGLLRRFKREAHHYIDKEPRNADLMGWLSLMRHHGAPTRLLDWTYSFYVAVYFAISDAQPDQLAAVWAVEAKKLRDAVESRPSLQDLKDHLAHDPNAKKFSTVRAIMRHSPSESFVFPLNPLRMNRRLVLQQGVFLVPGDISKPFMENLHAVGNLSHILHKKSICCTRDLLKSATRKLLEMNISSATLFPGLDGFAQNLRAIIPFPELRATDAFGME